MPELPAGTLVFLAQAGEIVYAFSATRESACKQSGAPWAE